MPIGSHHSPVAETTTWLTPRFVLQALGEFDLDPCCPVSMPWKTARKMLTPVDDGLNSGWHGRVWMNPPYGRETGKWLERLSLHNCGTALIFARTETRDWHDWIWSKASGILFLRGRLHFCYADGTRAKANSGGPSALIAYGEGDAEILRTCSLDGKFIEL